MDNNLKKIICRKCGGNHFTVKCGKETNPVNDNVKPYNNDKVNDNVKPYNNDKVNDKPHNDNLKPYNNVKLDNDKVNNKPVNNKPFNKSAFKPYKEHNKPKPEYKQKYKVQMSNLPDDITEEELMELTSDWGNICRIKVVKHTENNYAYVDFLYQDQAEYFVKALDKTPFDNLYLSVILSN